jgi:hypothetical protein
LIVLDNSIISQVARHEEIVQDLPLEVERAVSPRDIQAPSLPSQGVADEVAAENALVADIQNSVHDICTAIPSPVVKTPTPRCSAHIATQGEVHVLNPEAQAQNVNVLMRKWDITGPKHSPD